MDLVSLSNLDDGLVVLVGEVNVKAAPLFFSPPGIGCGVNVILLEEV